MAVKNNRIIESKHDLMDLINKVNDLWVDNDIDKEDTDNAYNQVYK